MRHLSSNPVDENKLLLTCPNLTGFFILFQNDIKAENRKRRHMKKLL